MGSPHESGWASGLWRTRTRLLVPSGLITFRHSHLWRTVFLMSSPTSAVLRQLNHLNRSSPEFHDQLSNALYGEEYQQCVRNLQNDDLAWLVEYLDKVRRSRPKFPALHSSRRRLSTASILPVRLPGNAYANSGPDAVLWDNSQHRTRFLPTLVSAAIHSPQEVMVMCTREHLTV